MKILTFLLTLFLIVIAEDGVDDWTYVFFYGSFNFLHVEENFKIPLNDLLKDAVAVEIR